MCTPSLSPFFDFSFFFCFLFSFLSLYYYYYYYNYYYYYYYYYYYFLFFFFLILLFLFIVSSIMWLIMSQNSSASYGSYHVSHSWGVMWHPTLYAMKNVQFRLSRNSTKFDVVAKFRETISTVKSVSSFEI